MLLVKRASCYEMLKPLLNAVSQSQNKIMRSSNIYTHRALPYRVEHVGDPKEEEKAEMANSRLQRWCWGWGGGCWTIFVKNFMEIELHPQNIWVSLMQHLPMEKCPVQPFLPGLLRTCLGPAARVGKEPGVRNLGPDPGLKSNGDLRRKCD